MRDGGQVLPRSTPPQAEGARGWENVWPLVFLPIFAQEGGELPPASDRPLPASSLGDDEGRTGRLSVCVVLHV